jgi:hypothetical protein
MKHSKFVLQPILDSNTVPLLFILGAVLLNLLSNALYDAAKDSLSKPLQRYSYGCDLVTAMLEPAANIRF